MHQPGTDWIEPVASGKRADPVFVSLGAHEIVDHPLDADPNGQDQNDRLGQLQDPASAAARGLSSNRARSLEAIALGMGFLDPRNAAVEVVKIWINPHFTHPE